MGEPSKNVKEFADLRAILPEAIVKEMEKAEREQKKPGHDGKGKSVKLTLDSKGRKGKTVTVVNGLQHNPQTLEAIAKTLKEYCGAGGTVRGMTIEIQGDQRAKIKEKLTELNYLVK
jgi:translation initiation factor 1